MTEPLGQGPAVAALRPQGFLLGSGTGRFRAVPLTSLQSERGPRAASASGPNPIAAGPWSGTSRAPCSHLALLSLQGGRAEGGHSHEPDGPEEAREVCKPV